MTWTETHRYYDRLRAVVDQVERTDDGALPWCDEFAEIFRDPAGLVLALRRHWQLIVRAQVDEPYDPDGRPSAELRAMMLRHRSLLAVLRTHDTEPSLTTAVRGMA
ncbi:hypothetical protein [Actinocrispum wychmicini]|uniref:Uncharacterized protein n=1 Tax=Actinocrispum wychmicini TaxID=1213861 RepID=A0A4R2JU50_9PSEU|nr:hypothetical protein [Actinocrispum wychmicini]TCO60828.1 hypothetical protein EV192_103409 [Actinocrispum wychmicini]